MGVVGIRLGLSGSCRAVGSWTDPLYRVFEARRSDVGHRGTLSSSVRFQKLRQETRENEKAL